MRSAPTCISINPSHIEVFYRGSDDALWHLYYDGNKWTKMESLGGMLTSAPAVCSIRSNTFSVFSRGPDNAMWNK